MTSMARLAAAHTQPGVRETSFHSRSTATENGCCASLNASLNSPPCSAQTPAPFTRKTGPTTVFDRALWNNGAPTSMIHSKSSSPSPNAAMSSSPLRTSGRISRHLKNCAVSLNASSHRISASASTSATPMSSPHQAREAAHGCRGPTKISAPFHGMTTSLTRCCRIS